MPIRDGGSRGPSSISTSPVTEVVRTFRTWPSTLVEVRAFVQAQAAVVGLSQRRASDLLIAVNEAATNAIEHSRGLTVKVIWRAANFGVQVDVIDDGIFHARPGTRQTRESEHFGIDLMRGLVDEFEMVKGSPERLGTLIRLTVFEQLDLGAVLPSEDPPRAFPLRRRLTGWAALATAAAVVALALFAASTLSRPQTRPAGTSSALDSPSVGPQGALQPSLGGPQGDPTKPSAGPSNVAGTGSDPTAPGTSATPQSSPPGATQPTNSRQSPSVGGSSSNGPDGQPGQPPSPAGPSPAQGSPSGPTPSGGPSPDPSSTGSPPVVAVPPITLPELPCPEVPSVGTLAIESGLAVKGVCRWVVGVVAGVAEQPGGYTLTLAALGGEVQVEGQGVHAFDGVIAARVLPGQNYPQPRSGERVALLGTILGNSSGGSLVVPVWAIDFVDRGVVETSVPAPIPSEGGTEPSCVAGTGICPGVPDSGAIPTTALDASGVGITS